MHRKSRQVARKAILDAIAFYQNSIAKIRRASASETAALLEHSTFVLTQLDQLELRGWPPSLSHLAEETRHLAARFDAMARARFPGISTMSRGDRRLDPYQHCA